MNGRAQVNLAAAPSQWAAGHESVEWQFGYKMPKSVHQSLVDSLAGMGLGKGGCWEDAATTGSAGFDARALERDEFELRCHPALG
jgi:hypothetical protein